MESALLKINNDVNLSLSRDKDSEMVLLDMSTAFYAINHGILFRHLPAWFRLTGNVLDWLFLICSNEPNPSKFVTPAQLKRHSSKESLKDLCLALCYLHHIVLHLVTLFLAMTAHTTFTPMIPSCT
jgi:hypothetical protein